MALGGDHGGRGGGRGQHQSRGAGNRASGHQHHGGAGEHTSGPVQGTCMGRGGNQPVFHIPAMGAMTILLGVGEVSMNDPMLGVVGEAVLCRGPVLRWSCYAIPEQG